MIDNKWGTYALVSILLSYPYCHAILVAWTSKNSNNVGTRSVSAALYNVGSLLSTSHLFEQMLLRLYFRVPFMALIGTIF